MNRRKNILEQALLLDIYGELLTDKQRETMELYCNEDLSLGEIADAKDISRQGARNCIKAAEHLLAHYEDGLGLVRRFQQLRGYVDRLEKLIGENKTPETEELLADIRRKI